MAIARSLALTAFALLFSSSMAAGGGDTKLTYNGVYTAWGQSQHAFTFNADTYDDNYVVQMLRLKLAFAGNENVKVVTRFDMAQGWWGVDNALRTAERTGTGSGSTLFDFKDTNFLLHVDQAYVDFGIGDQPLRLRVGRQWYGLGNKLMVDNNYEGIQLDLNGVVGDRVTLSWAKVSEGADSLSDLHVTDAAGATIADNRDADLFTANFHHELDSFSYDAFAFYYDDGSVGDGTAYVPDHLQFFKTRFSAQPTTLMAVGLAGKYKVGKLTLDGEFDYLTGDDDVANTTHGAKQNWDINDGSVSGYNAFVKANFAVSPRLTVGGLAGLGSGDDDLTGGAGNVNKLRTSGFFYMTEIWEDSVMPNEEGVTPQGLGAPNVRGYRELENTTAVQINGSLKPRDKLELFGSLTHLKASNDIHAWSVVTDANGDVVNATIDPNTKASDIGNEIDFRISCILDKGLSTHLRGGYFIPGDAAKYLITGSTAKDDAAWELKTMVTYKF